MRGRQILPKATTQEEENAMICDRSRGESIWMSKAKLCIMQVFARPMKNHNLTTSLLVTLIVIREFS
jgi:hypothetical protein